MATSSLPSNGSELEAIHNYVAAGLTIESDDFDYEPFAQRVDSQLVKKASEEQLQAKLEFPWVKRRRHGAKVAGSLTRTDSAVVGVTLELRMVPGVESFHAELDPAASLLTDDEILEERKVPVVAAGTPQSVEAQIPVAVRAREASWGTERRGTKPLIDRLWVGNTPSQIGPVSGEASGK